MKLYLHMTPRWMLGKIRTAQICGLWMGAHMVPREAFSTNGSPATVTSRQ